MNEKAYLLYLGHGIDLQREPLYAAVCAQHMNGGLSVTMWYESPSLPGLYPVGECAGVFGVRRPGGSALNSTQVSSQRAAEKIAWENRPAPDLTPELEAQLVGSAALGDRIGGDGALDTEAVLALMREDGILHDGCAAFLRDREKIGALLRRTEEEMKSFSSLRAADHRAFGALMIRRDTLAARAAVLSAEAAYIDDGGLSRGSFLVVGREGDGTDEAHADKVLETSLALAEDGTPVCGNRFVPVRPIPQTDNWFENVYNAFDGGARFADPENGTGEQEEGAE
jgi:succinate dehydrogenase/fumarate reductase flavoprotein subunit